MADEFLGIFGDIYDDEGKVERKDRRLEALEAKGLLHDPTIVSGLKRN